MSNKSNLIPGGHKLTKEEQSQGGKKSGEVRRLQGAVKRALESKASSADYKKIFKQFGIEENDRNYAQVIACAIITKAAQGDISAASFVRDTIGEKPKDEISLDGGVIIVDDITD